MRQQGQDYSYLYDGKGNVTAVLDSSQNTVATYTYDEFGRVVSKSGTLDQPFQFSTKYYDQQTGLNYYGYRFYSPALGRWINRDPLGEEGGVNLYGFVGNNPVNKTDPLGLKWSQSWGMNFSYDDDPSTPSGWDNPFFPPSPPPKYCPTPCTQSWYTCWNKCMGLFVPKFLTPTGGALLLARYSSIASVSFAGTMGGIALGIYGGAASLECAVACTVSSCSF
jgi:RHS repeat-associated protein